MKKKHRRDKNHGKQGWVGGNPRWGKTNGNHKARRPKFKQQINKELNQ